MSLADLAAGLLQGFAGVLGRKNAPVPEPVTPIVAEQEDPDLQELTPQEIAEIELAESMWPQKELAAMFMAEYARGEVPPELEVEQARIEAERTAVFQEQMRDRRELKKAGGPPLLPKPLPDIVQPAQASHVDREIEIVMKIDQIRREAQA